MQKQRNMTESSTRHLQDKCGSVVFRLVVWEPRFMVSLSQRKFTMGEKKLRKILSSQYKCNFSRLRVNRGYHWPRGLMRSFKTERLLELWFRVPTGTRMSVYCECFVLSGRILCDGPIPLPEESYRLWYVIACDLLP